MVLLLHSVDGNAPLENGRSKRGRELWCFYMVGSWTEFASSISTLTRVRVLKLSGAHFLLSLEARESLDMYLLGREAISLSMEYSGCSRHFIVHLMLINFSPNVAPTLLCTLGYTSLATFVTTLNFVSECECLLANDTLIHLGHNWFCYILTLCPDGSIVSIMDKLYRVVYSLVATGNSRSIHEPSRQHANPPRNTQAVEPPQTSLYRCPTGPILFLSRVNR